MIYLDFYDKLNSMNNKEHVETFLVYHLSLVIAEIKPAATVTIKKSNIKLHKGWNDFGINFMDSLNLKFVELRESYDSIIVMIYSESILKQELNKDDTMEFLLTIGYPPNASINDCVTTLKSRYEKYHCPHELGLFLGIPFKDVKDFMECSTKKCLLCGYWKVYNDSNKAKIIFNKYDEIKEYTIKNILKGSSCFDLALSIKEYVYTSAKSI